MKVPEGFKVVKTENHFDCFLCKYTKQCNDFYEKSRTTGAVSYTDLCEQFTGHRYAHHLEHKNIFYTIYFEIKKLKLWH